MRSHRYESLIEKTLICAGCAAGLLAFKAAAALALARARPELAADAEPASVVAIALTVLAISVLMVVRRAPAIGAALLTTALTLDLAATFAIVGIPPVHPLLQALFIAVVYGGTALLACAAASAIVVLRRRPAPSPAAPRQPHAHRSIAARSTDRRAA